MTTNRDLLLDLKTHDLMREKFDLKITDGVFATRQRLKIRLKLFLREWFLNQDAGIPYYDAVFVKNPDLFLIESVLKSAILSTPRVLSITSFEVDLNNATRVLFINFSVSTSDGAINDVMETIAL